MLIHAADEDKRKAMINREMTWEYEPHVMTDCDYSSTPTLPSMIYALA